MEDTNVDTEKKPNEDPLESLSGQKLLTYLSEEERHEHYPCSSYSFVEQTTNTEQ